MWLLDNWHMILFWCIFHHLFPNVSRYFDPYFIALYNWIDEKVERFLQKDMLCAVCNKTEEECDHEADGILENEI